MAQKVIVYFHGFGSNAKSDKVERLKAMGFETIAFPIDLDPNISIASLVDNINLWLIENWAREYIDIWFIGTSLGAWYAHVVGAMFDVNTILINPSLSPQESLKKYGVDSNILENYEKCYVLENLNEKDHVIVSNCDEVIDFSKKNFMGAGSVIRTDLGSHRFNGPEFETFVGSILNEN